MGYEQYCIDYATNGNPEQDARDYELNSEFDGFGDPDFNVDPGCPECGYRADCMACKVARADVDQFEAECAERDECSDAVPF